MAGKQYRGWTGPKRNKYGSSKVEVDGIVFDSAKEASRYNQLKLLESAGIIRDLRRQVKYVLIPTQYSKTEFNKNKTPKVIEKECAYYADFVYIDEFGAEHVEDVKGYRNPSTAGYAQFVIKRKLMLHLNGIRIEEV